MSRPAAYVEALAEVRAWADAVFVPVAFRTPVDHGRVEVLTSLRGELDRLEAAADA